jgi:hypothetical protein
MTIGFTIVRWLLVAPLLLHGWHFLSCHGYLLPFTCSRKAPSLYEDPELALQLCTELTRACNFLVFCRYALWRLAKEGRNVLYEYPKGLAAGSSIVFGAAMSDVYIADGCEPTVAGPATLVISSPEFEKVIYHEFEKRAVSLFMPTPTTDEILLMRKHCFVSSASSGIDEALELTKVEERMGRWGPVPRYVLDQVDEEREKLEATIATQTLSSLHELVRTMSERVAVRDVSFRVVHYNIFDNFSRVTYRWASPYVAKRVVQVLAKKDRADRFALLASMLEEKVWLEMSSELFEEWCGHKMSDGGSFRIRRLGIGNVSGGGSGRNPKLVGTKALRHQHLFQQADEHLGLVLDGDGRGVLHVPEARTQPSVLRLASDLPALSDFHGRRFRAKACFATADFIEGNGVCSNATVNSKHSILVLGKKSSNGLLPLIRRMYPDVHGAEGPIPFLFLVPSLVFEESRAGLMEIEEPKLPETSASPKDEAAHEAAVHDVAAARSLAARVVQYAVEIPSPPTR